MEKDLAKILITEENIKMKVQELGKEICRDYAGQDLLVVGILKGAIMFMSDLVRAINLPLNIDFMAVTSYGKSTESSGAVRILKDLDSSIEGRNVLIVEDIVDTGLTLKYLTENLSARAPKSVRICTFLNKPERRKVEVDVHYTGFVIPDEFVVGYGLDFAEKYRNLPFIAVLKPEAYA